jgi:hypothetical protein
MAADNELTVGDRLVVVAERALEVISDQLADITAEPWPARAGQFPGLSADRSRSG